MAASSGLVCVGVHVGHDGGCAVLVDGEVAAAVADERLSRWKGANSWWMAYRYCLDAAGVEPSQIDIAVVTNSGRPLRDPRSVFGGWLPPEIPVATVDHHLSHAVAAFAFSPFAEATVLAADAGGNSGRTEGVFGINGRGVEPLYSTPESRPRYQSMGATYESFTNFLGFSDEECGKTMALAAFGDPTAYSFELFDFDPGGVAFSRLEGDHHWAVTELAEEHGLDFGPAFPASTTATAQNIAAFLQEQFTRAMIATIRSLAGRTSVTDVCITGGVGLNCVTNGAARRQLDDLSLYFFPACSDTGQALGGAVYGHYLLSGEVPRPTDRSMRYGRVYDDDEILRAMQGAPDTTMPYRLSRFPWSYERVDAPASTAAELIAGGDVVAWFQGRSEYGPRALGSRSILASPAVEGMAERLNQIKRREWFRPFGPMIPVDRAVKGLGDNAPELRYMVEAAEVPAELAAMAPGAVHVDGTTRPQVVDPTSDPMLSELLAGVEERTGCPLVLNTSFNIQEPLVETPGMALSTFLQSDADHLIMGNYLIQPRLSR